MVDMWRILLLFAVCVLVGSILVWFLAWAKDRARPRLPLLSRDRPEKKRRYRIRWSRRTIYKRGEERGFRDQCIAEVKAGLLLGWLPIEGANWHDTEAAALAEIERHKMPLPRDRYIDVEEDWGDIADRAISMAARVGLGLTLIMGAVLVFLLSRIGQ